MTGIDIRKFRKEYQLTQAEISVITGVTIRAVQSWEQNQRTVPQSAILLLEAYREKQEVVKENVLREPEEEYGLKYKEMYLNYKEMYLDAKYTIEVQKKYIESLEQQLNTKRKAG